MKHIFAPLKRLLASLKGLLALQPTLLAMLLPAAAMAATWPVVDHPPDARVERVGDQVRLNGVPMRIMRALTPASTDAVVAHYRQALGAPTAHSRIGDTQVLAQERGDFFITITVSPQADGASEALVSIAERLAAGEAASRPLGFVLPAGSELLSDMESIDGQIASRQLVLMNTHNLRANLARFSASLAERGLLPDGAPLPRSADSDRALVQGFAGPRGDARLVLVHRGGATRAVLTLRSRQP